eukprot:CAMPEP_0172030392 /NCGR_PEP_ID=MMETSP1041-20130122/18697_1 /TAXON_ID=464988 /ORGANISM="Hemiselmis andersenii, Strain CCMP439" /LENGTH=83 /DNA_ID=CAMNT_0012686733 /DNA_START=158 /DNA_END=405 /DNA_ORIENTATION=+
MNEDGDEKIAALRVDHRPREAEDGEGDDATEIQVMNSKKHRTDRNSHLQAHPYRQRREQEPAVEYFLKYRRRDAGADGAHRHR